VNPFIRATLAAACLLLAVPALAKKPLGPSERVDLNRATVAELMRLPGVGLKKAQAITAHRSKTPFQRPEDVTKVKGCGPSWFSKVRPNLTAGAGPATPATPATPAATTPAAPAKK
jgi:competence protein ComEA